MHIFCNSGDYGTKPKFSIAPALSHYTANGLGTFVIKRLYCFQLTTTDMKPIVHRRRTIFVCKPNMLLCRKRKKINFYNAILFINIYLMTINIDSHNSWLSRLDFVCLKSRFLIFGGTTKISLFDKRLVPFFAPPYYLEIPKF